MNLSSSLSDGMLNLDIIVPVASISLILLVLFFSFTRFSKFSLRSKLITMFLSVSLFPLSIFIIINFVTTRTALTDSANALLTLAATQTGKKVDDFIDNSIAEIEQETQSLSIITALFVLPEGSGAIADSVMFNVREELKSFAERNPEYQESISLINREGEFIAGYPTLISEGSKYLGESQTIVNSFQVALISNVPYVSPVLINLDNQEKYFYIASSVRSAEGGNLGLMIVKYDADLLQNIISSQNNTAGEESYGILFDELYIQLAHGNNPSEVFRSITNFNEELFSQLKSSGRLPNLSRTEFINHLPELEQGLINSRKEPVFTVPSGGTIQQTSQVAVYHLESTTWRVAFFQPQEVFLALANQQNRIYTILGFVVAGIVVLSSFGATRLISRPISNLSELVRKISAGDLSNRVPITTRDEIGNLGTAFNTMATQIQSLLEGMENQISERTKDLERRAVQLQTAAEVARDASSARDIDSLLSNAVELINQRFGFYHAGIFLLDENGEFAVLRATNSEGGKQMLTHGHKLKVGEVGIVGETTHTGRPHIALDVGVDATHFANPFLPDTRSEMALPLMVGDEIIGALDVQSRDEGAFDEEHITILQVLADQLAIAIQNSQLLNEVQETVEELQSSYGDFTRRSWREWSRGTHLSGYRFSGSQVEIASEQSPEIQNVWNKGQPVKISTDSQSILAIPLKLRDITIGVIKLNIEGDQIPAEFESLINDIAERLALAIENARLLETTQQRAAQEQMVSELTAKMRETLDVETVLRTAVNEIRGALELHDITIQLESNPAGVAPE